VYNIYVHPSLPKTLRTLVMYNNVINIDELPMYELFKNNYSIEWIIVNYAEIYYDNMIDVVDKFESINEHCDINRHNMKQQKMMLCDL
jgi:hypothetical protein